MVYSTNGTGIKYIILFLKKFRHINILRRDHLKDKQHKIQLII